MVPRFQTCHFDICQGMHAFPLTRKATPRVALLEKRKTLGDSEPQPCSETLVVALLCDVLLHFTWKSLCTALQKNGFLIKKVIGRYH